MMATELREKAIGGMQVSPPINWRRRSRVEIIAEILRIAKRGAKKTRIVYGANLNFKMLDNYLQRLEKAGLLVSDV